MLSIEERSSGQPEFMKAPKIAWLSRIGISRGRFLCNTFVATDAANPGHFATAPTTSANVGETITDAGVYPANAEDGDQEDEIWKCTITERAGTVDRCYVVHESKVKAIVRGVKCQPIS